MHIRKNKHKTTYLRRTQKLGNKQKRRHIQNEKTTTHRHLVFLIRFKHFHQRKTYEEEDILYTATGEDLQPVAQEGFPEGLGIPRFFWRFSGICLRSLGEKTPQVLVIRLEGHLERPKMENHRKHNSRMSF